MAHSHQYTLRFDGTTGTWKLENDKTHRTVRTFATKKRVKGGELRNALGRAGGSVKIRTRTGTFVEERTYPPSTGPRKSR